MSLDIDTWLDVAVEEGRLRPIDRAFARFLATLDASAGPRVLAAAALASRELGDGHICIDVEALGQMEPWLVDATDWLTGSPLVAGPAGDPAAPLVWDGGLLYLRRFWRDEVRVAEAIVGRLAPADTPVELKDELSRLFPGDGGTPDWQKIACAVAARGTFTVITGGPGTGKTTTVVRLLGLWQTLAHRRGEPRLRIRLAAPTGKAAARLNASIAGQIERLDVDPAVKQAIPAEVATLHRLLGSRPDSRAFRHDRDDPLHLDVLVIDEASMIDLELMAATLDALPAGARLVLLGDKDQLSSVEAGAVLGDLCARADAGHYDADTWRWLAAVCGMDVSPWRDGDARALDQRVVMLRHSHRFGAKSGIGELASAINRGDPAAARRAFESSMGDIAMHAPSAAAIATLAIEGRDGAPGYRAWFDWIERERPAADAPFASFEAWGSRALRAHARFQLLCASRHGDHGVVGQNERIARGLVERGYVDAGRDWYEGRPVMVTRNDYALGLMNGDVGVTLWIPDGQGGMALRVAFGLLDEHGRERVRFVVPSRLAAVDTVYAMTVHKSQGSEFEHTALALPAEPSPVLTRELLYTGVTRARTHFTLLAGGDIVAYAVGRKTKRASGLLRRLL
ncbi:exodeoxyribonuclease V subunit alpha [Luteibacter aegosomatis]|uniref:exodeoxyribonuclease V subunit alpha n=1 Tax=Luteibacter aegosomatis TaxID=2911537 RepID=UPI001FF986BD|nr:exodeoxyribonuclease V subunit alpha [Luteibacter aegosomatis]UPG84733.1 exodeoxyribonuclease V subunit alpha [Luteibacter aegosomatis]